MVSSPSWEQNMILQQLAKHTATRPPIWIKKNSIEFWTWFLAPKFLFISLFYFWKYFPVFKTIKVTTLWRILAEASLVFKCYWTAQHENKVRNSNQFRIDNGWSLKWVPALGNISLRDSGTMLHYRALSQIIDFSMKNCYRNAMKNMELRRCVCICVYVFVHLQVYVYMFMIA